SPRRADDGKLTATPSKSRTVNQRSHLLTVASMRSFSGGLWDRHRVESLHQRCHLTDVAAGKQTPPSGHGGITDAVLDDPEEFALPPFTSMPGELRPRRAEGA